MHAAAISSATATAAAPARALASPERLARLPADQQVQAAAGQFEAILLRQFLQDSVGKLMNPGGSDAGGGMYGFMLTDVIANQLAGGGGLGLAPIIARQLDSRPGAEKETES